MLKRIGLALAAAVIFLAVAAAPPLRAADAYPTRPITLVVPFAAGGPVDTLARILGERMRSALGQPLVIENITGAAGSIAVGRVVRAAPDGYTLSIGHWSTHVLNGAIYDLPYDLLKDLAPVALLPSNPMLIVSKNAVPATDLTQLIAWLRQNRVTIGTAGAGSASHVAGVYLQNRLGGAFTFVPYRGSAPALQDLVAGQIDLAVDQASNSLPHVRAGTIRGYAVTSATRLASAPDIPTVDEAGLPGLYISVWYGLWAPAGTPPAVVTRLNAAVKEALADAGVRARLADLGQEIPPPEQQTPQALAAQQEAEIAKWWPLIRAANIRAE